MYIFMELDNLQYGLEKFRLGYSSAYQALRVAIEPSKDDRKLLLARVLNQSEDAPENTHEAMLVCTIPNTDMRSRRR